MSNPINGRRQELARADAGLLDTDARQTPAFRLDVRRAVTMHPVLAGMVAGTVFLLLVCYALTRKPVYSAESLIYVEPLEVRVLNDGSAGGYDPSRYDSYLQQQVQTVERTDTLEAALAKLPPGMWSAPGENPASAVKRLGNALKVERVLNSYQLAIDVSASTAVAAAAGANAVTSAYLEAGRKDEHARADQRLQLLNEERQRISDDLTRDKAEQTTLGRSLGVANPSGASGNPYDLQSEGLRSQLASARLARDAVSAQLASVSGANGGGLNTAANELIVSDPGLVSIKQTLSQRRAVLSDQMAGLTPANPTYKQDQEEIAAIDRAMDKAADEARLRAERQLQDKLRLDLRRTADVEGRLNAQLAEQTSRATGAGPKLQRAAELDTDIQRLSTRYATVDDAIRGLQLETGGPGQAHLALAARVPDGPQPSRSRLVLWLSLPFALLCGCLAAVLALKRDPKLYLPGDLEEVLGFPPMCVLPKASEVGAAAYEDFLLRLAGGIEGAHRHGGARSFVFTPASIHSTNDALLQRVSAKLRQVGFRVICISTQGLMSSANNTFGSTEVEAAGAEIVRASEGAGANRMQTLLEEYDLVLVQAPALLGSALTEYVVRCADATILVVESTRTDRAELRRAALLLERLNPQGIGAVLEDMPMRFADPVFREAVRAAERSPLAHPERASARRPRSKPAQTPVASSSKGSSKAVILSPATRHESTPSFEARPTKAEAPEAAVQVKQMPEESEARAEAQPAEAQPYIEDQQTSTEPAYASMEESVIQEEPLVVSMEVGPLSFQKPAETWSEARMAQTDPPPTMVHALEPLHDPQLRKEIPEGLAGDGVPPAAAERGWRAWSYAENPIPEPREALDATIEDIRHEPAAEVSQTPVRALAWTAQGHAPELSHASSSGAQQFEAIKEEDESAEWDGDALLPSPRVKLPLQERSNELGQAAEAESLHNGPTVHAPQTDPILEAEPLSIESEDTAKERLDPAFAAEEGNHGEARKEPEPILPQAQAPGIPIVNPAEEVFVEDAEPLLEEPPGPSPSSQELEVPQMPEMRGVDAEAGSVKQDTRVRNEKPAEIQPTEARLASKPFGWVRRLLRLEDDSRPTVVPESHKEEELQVDAVRHEQAPPVSANPVSSLDMTGAPATPAVHRADVSRVESSVTRPREVTGDVILFRDPLDTRPDETWTRLEEPSASTTGGRALDSGHHWEDSPEGYLHDVSLQPALQNAQPPTTDAAQASPVHARQELPETPGNEAILEWPVEAMPAPAGDFSASTQMEALRPQDSHGLEREEFLPMSSEPAQESSEAASNIQIHASKEALFPAAPEIAPASVEAREPESAGYHEQRTPEPEVTTTGFTSQWNPIRVPSEMEHGAEAPLRFPRFRMLPRVAQPAELLRNEEPPQAEGGEAAVDHSPTAAEAGLHRVAAPVQRTGLNKAIRRIALDDGPPARASEGLTAMRTASGVHRVATPEAVTVEPQKTVAVAGVQPVVSRHWAMLSRFGRPDAMSGTADPQGLELATAGSVKERAAEPARDPRV